MHKLIGLMIFGSLFGTFFIPNTYGQEATRTLLVESEYYAPLSAHRQIDTASLHILFYQKSYFDDRLAFWSGATVTHAWGNIIRRQWRSDSAAWGIGPTVALRYQPRPWQWEQYALSLDAGGGLIFYDHDFPAGGDFYNFMWRFGPTLNYRLDEHRSLTFGYKLMHVSNGQPSHNPAYNGKGLNLGLKITF